jgi:hypothetical protein
MRWLHFWNIFEEFWRGRWSLKCLADLILRYDMQNQREASEIIKVHIAIYWEESVYTVAPEKYLDPYLNKNNEMILK